MKVKLFLVIPLFVMFCGVLQADTIEQFTVTISADAAYGGPFTTDQTWVFQIQQNPTMSMPFVTGIPGGGFDNGGGFEIDNVPAIYDGTLLENLFVDFYYPGDLVEFGCNPAWTCAWYGGPGGAAPNFDVPVIDWSDGPTINEGMFTSTAPSIFGGGPSFPTISVVPLSAVPEPTTTLMLAVGLLMVLVLRRWVPAGKFRT